MVQNKMLLPAPLNSNFCSLSLSENEPQLLGFLVCFNSLEEGELLYTMHAMSSVLAFLLEDCEIDLELPSAAGEASTAVSR